MEKRAEKKIVVFYWNKVKKETPEAFLEFLLEYRRPYFGAIDKFAEVIIVIGEGNYKGGLGFGAHYSYQNGEFIYSTKSLVADVIFDRTMGFKFPVIDPVLDKQVINNAHFKNIVRNKFTFAKTYPEYSPSTVHCENRENLMIALGPYPKGSTLVVKPRTGRRGEGVYFGTKDELLSMEHRYPVILQEFVETLGGFMYPDRRHDIRIVILNGKIAHAFARFTRDDTYRANISQGGDYLELPYKEIPLKLREIAEKIAKDIKSKYENPFYSIDFGIAKEGIYIFEMNNRIGFPEEGKKNFPLFLAEFTRLLREKLKL